MHTNQTQADKKHRFGRILLTGIGIRALGAACGFLFNVALARTLGKAGTGTVMFYLTFAGMMGLVATGGMDVVGLRELSRSADDRSQTSAVLAAVASTALPSLVLFSIGGFVLLLFFRSSLAGPGDVWICAICALMLCLTALQKMLSDWLIALREFVASQLVFYFLNRVASLVLIAAIAGLAVNATAFMQTFILVYGAGLLVAILYAVGRIPALVSGPFSFPQWPRMPLLRDGVSCAAQNAAFIVLNLSPFLLLGALSTSSEIGLFGVSQRLVAVVILALTTISQLAMRDFSRAYGDSDFVGLARTLTTNMRLTFMTAIVLALPLVLFAPLWLSIFGKPFAAASSTLALLSIAICAQCLGMPFQAALLTTNNERLARNVTFFCALIGIALNVLLIPRWGAVGAALGTGAGLALQSIGHTACALRTLPLRFHLPVFEIAPRLGPTGVC